MCKRDAEGFNCPSVGRRHTAKQKVRLQPKLSIWLQPGPTRLGRQRHGRQPVSLLRGAEQPAVEKAGQRSRAGALWACGSASRRDGVWLAGWRSCVVEWHGASAPFAGAHSVAGVRRAGVSPACGRVTAECRKGVT